MNAKRAILGGVLSAWMMFSGFDLRAHDGPEHEIEELTERIRNEGASAELLLQRAVEHNVLNQGVEAAKDLEKALEFDARSSAIHRELGRAYFSIGKTNEALNTIGLGLKHASAGPERAGLLALRSEVLRARGDYAGALDDLNGAIKEHAENTEWYYARSQMQEQLQRKEERIQGLEAGIRETGSGLLEGELIDALIDGGRPEAALARVERELKEARWKSTWLIRRARVFQATNRKDQAQADAKAAVEELDNRITAAARDPLLLADRGMAHELLGEREEARQDYESARDKGMTDEWIRERISALRDAAAKP